MSEDLEATRALPKLWAALREDAEFRGTFLGAVVLPALCALLLVGWIVLGVLRG